MTRDDDDLDDSMRSMRSVWVSMRDEEPSSKGLDALLAAAREKAVEMKPAPSWWQTLFATLRRPPVLALATVVVLVGGAALIGQRRSVDDLDATKLQAPDKKETPVVEPPALPPPPPPSGGPGIDQELAEIKKAPAADPPSADPVKREPVDVVVRPPVVVEQPRSQVQSGSASVRTRIPTTTVDTGASVPQAPDHSDAPPTDPSKHEKIEEAQTQKPPVVQQGGIVTTESTSVKSDAAGKKQPAADESRGGRLEIADDEVAVKPGSSAPVAIETTSSGKTKAVAKPPPQRGPSSTQLVQQAESAAARNDCTAVRVTVERIKKTDADAYKKSVEKNAALARCLAK